MVSNCFLMVSGGFLMVYICIRVLGLRVTFVFYNTCVCFLGLPVVDSELLTPLARTIVAKHHFQKLYYHQKLLARSQETGDFVLGIPELELGVLPPLERTSTTNCILKVVLSSQIVGWAPRN